MKRIALLCLMLLCTLLGACTFAPNMEQAAAPTEIPASLPAEKPTELPAPTTTEAPVDLVVYSQVSGFQGEQQGWFAKVLADKFNVTLTILPDIPEEEGELEQADIIVFGGVGSSTGNLYRAAAEQGKLLDWEAGDLLAEHGAYILEHMTKALEYNKTLTPDIGKIFGFGHGVAPNADSVEEVLYTWDVRWDLYKELGYPEVKNLDDFVAVLEDMKALCPVDEKGKETYAVSLWSDWDETMVFYVSALAAAYYGLDELGVGLYDTTTGAFYGALEEDGPYLELLQFFNTLYRKGLLDPASATQTYDEANEKLKDGGALFSVFNYTGGMAYNTVEHMAGNTYMAPLVPEEATPLADGMSVYGGRRIWTISAKTEYPELCMDIINWLCTPEGTMVSLYGPRGLIWDYDAEGNTYFTEFGKACREDGTTMMPGEYAGTTYRDGFPQINNITWSLYAENPDSNGECYHSDSWKSNVTGAACVLEQDWREVMGTLTAKEYLLAKQYVVVPETQYEEPEKEAELQACWEQVADCLVQGSWNAVYTESEEEFMEAVAELKSRAEAFGYEKCVSWCIDVAATRYALEEAARK